MTKQLVLTALGADRPGIVNDLSNILTASDFNIEDSRMSVLGGEFAILMLVSGTDESVDTFNSDVADLESKLGMKIVTKVTSGKITDKENILYKVEIVSIDHPGIVKDIANFFSSRKLNIIDMETKRYSAAHTGTAMFSLDMTIGIAKGVEVAEIENALSEMCDELNLDVKMVLESTLN